MKDKLFTFKIASTFKKRIVEAADYLGINQSQLVIRAINEFLDRLANNVGHNV